MHALRKLAREIHRRSVWQVVTVYLATSWVGYQAVEVATERVGLPVWTPAMALVLLVLGFPVVTATAVLQGGLPWLRIEDWGDPNDLEGLTPADVHVIPHLHPMYGVGLFTWRNAVLGGVASLALLVTSVVAYLAMWALGIGPLGSLLARGVIAEGDRVLVTEFENRTDQVVLGAALTETLSSGLAESRLVEVVGHRDIASQVARMTEDAPGSPSAGVAGRVAAEEGIRALVEGGVVRSAKGYVITVTITVPPSIVPIARFREVAATEDEVIGATHVLSQRIRERLGESLREIRAGASLTELYGVSPHTTRR